MPKGKRSIMSCLSGKTAEAEQYKAAKKGSETSIKSVSAVKDFPHKDKVLGTIYGNCIGDAIGLLSEFMVKSEAEKYYGSHRGNIQYEHKVPDMHRARWENGDWTDDSDQMILIMESIVEQQGQINQVDYAQRLHHWARRGFSELGDYAGMGLGATTNYVLKHPQFLKNPVEAARDIWVKSGRDAAPNGAAMRTSVLGVYKSHDLYTVAENTKKICTVTHYDPRCQATAVAMTTAIAMMVEGHTDINYIIDKCFHMASAVFVSEKKAREMEEELRKYLYCTKISKLQLDEHQKIGYTYKALGAGFWALKQNNFRDAMESIIFEGGDADSNGAVAGALLGCKVGVSGLPREWLEGLVHKKWLDDRINKFVSVMYPEPNTQPEVVSPETLNEDRKQPTATAATAATAATSHGQNLPTSHAEPTTGPELSSLTLNNRVTEPESPTASGRDKGYQDPERSSHDHGRRRLDQDYRDHQLASVKHN